MRRKRPDDAVDAGRVDHYLDQLHAAATCGERRRILVDLCRLAPEPAFRDWLVAPQRLGRLLQAVAAQPTPSYDAYDISLGLRGEAGGAEVGASLAVHAAAAELLGRLGPRTGGALRELVTDGPLPAGKLFRFGADQPEVYGAKLTALRVLASTGQGDARLWRRIATDESEPWAAIEAAMCWSATHPRAAAAVLVRRLTDVHFGRAGEVRYYARRVRSLSAELGRAAAAHVAHTSCHIHRRLELLAAETADETWATAILEQQSRSRPVTALAALNRLLAAVDPDVLAELRAEESRRISRGQPPDPAVSARSLGSGPGDGKRFAAVVLAAGRGERLGGGKLALPWGRSTVLGTVLNNLSAAGVMLRHVVLGHDRELLDAILRSAGAVAVPNDDFVSGMLSSVQTGLRSLPEVDAAVLLPGDLPLVQARTIRRLCGAWLPGDGMLIPTHRFQSGHPVLIAGDLFGQVAELDPRVGLRQLRERAPDRVRYLPVDDPGVLIDIDTPGDYLLHRPPGTPCDRRFEL